MSEWNHPNWPNPPGQTPTEPGLYWVQMYGWVHEACIYRQSGANDLHVKIWQPGGVATQWDGQKLSEFRRFSDSLYSTWKAREIPVPWERTDLKEVPE